MFDLTQLENGKLRLSLDYADEAEKAELENELRELMTGKTDILILIDETEKYWTNGSYQPFDAGSGDPFVGLTWAPCIAESMTYTDKGNAIIEGKFWYYGDYMIRSFLDDLLENGYADFNLCK